MVRSLRAAVIACVLVVPSLGCKSPAGSSAEREPAGTPTDPVTVCKRMGDVCRLDESRLGVCNAAPAGSAPASCDGRTPCFVCMSQH
ncbi:MAG TPA: hypothetical protein VK698_38005 [Kofleriaceae bacterium]|nr:hypothetical protein [Kofleriaceae bacterium]